MESCPPAKLLEAVARSSEEEEAEASHLWSEVELSEAVEVPVVVEEWPEEVRLLPWPAQWTGDQA